MNADYRLIRLSRKTNSMNLGEDDNAGQHYLSTDYFDELHCMTRQPSDSFCSIMGIGEWEPQSASEIAIQSYALYCSEETQKRYCGRKCYEDPFDDEDKNKHFLSLIQVYITPEVTARVEMGADGTAQDFLLKIEEDIHAILDRFVTEHEVSMSYRIYSLLSTGDFAVVVRSVRSETSFEVSSALRRRYVCIKNDPDARKLVLYKTYTLLTMAESVINAQSDEKTDDNQFVIRCCYSNKYWSEKELVDAFWKDKGDDDIRIFSLNGRYDFTIYFTDREFKEVFPYIVQYKHIHAGQALLEAFEESSITVCNGVNYLIYLMKHGYVSYVNERYFLKRVSIPANTGDLSLLKSVKGGAFIFQINDERYQEVLKQYRGVMERLKAMHTNRWDLINYMDLLYKLILLCQTINSLSDTRIYASVLLEQISVLLSSINSYVLYMEEDGSGAVLELIEEYLKESVGALDKYSQYIRNNNLQSLQTPNYNIETNTSMEKLLIAYSEFVYTVIDYYMGSRAAASAGEDVDGKCYVPIVVPDLKRDTVSVEVMFPEWNIYNAQSEKVEEKTSCRTYLMVITCPTLRELGDVPYITASLFHEIAHQFRYEKRAERNRAILLYTVEHVFELIASAIVAEFKMDKSFVDMELVLTAMFRDSMRDVFLEIWCPASGAGGEIHSTGYLNQNREAPLAFYEECILADVNLFLKSWNYGESISVYVRKFVGGILPYMPADGERTEQLLALEELVKQALSSESYDAWEKNIIELQHKAVELYYICGRVIFKDDGTQLKRWEDRWNKIFSPDAWGRVSIPWDALGNGGAKDYFGISDDTPGRERLMAVCVMVRGFSQWLGELGADEEQYRMNMVRKSREQFEQDVYRRICAAWDERSRSYLENDRYSPLLQCLDEAGRYFGIDYKSRANQNIFAKVLGRNINHMEQDVLGQISMDIAAYREETADLFMCSVIPLNLTGYVNLMAQKLHIDEYIPKLHLKRIVRVTAAKWCSEDADNFQSFYRSYCKECSKLFQNTVRYMNEMLAQYGIQPGWSEAIIQWDAEPTDEQAIRFAAQVEECIRFVRRAEPCDMKCRADLQHVESMLKIIDAMARESFLTLFNFYDNKAIYWDYKKGVRVLEQLELKDMWGTAVLVKALCDKIRKIMNCPWDKYQDVREELNCSIAQFLLGMHYENKRRNAGKTEEACDGC